MAERRQWPGVASAHQYRVGEGGAWSRRLAFPLGRPLRRAASKQRRWGPFDTVPVGRYPRGASPFGLLDVAGQVYEWTATPAGPGRALVKGGSWDDRGCGVCRPAAGHGRPVALKHILIGFRLVREE